MTQHINKNIESFVKNYTAILELMDSDADNILEVLDNLFSTSTLSNSELLKKIGHILNTWRLSRKMKAAVFDLPEEDRLVAYIKIKLHALHEISGFTSAADDSDEFEILGRELIGLKGVLASNEAIAHQYMDYIISKGKKITFV